MLTPLHSQSSPLGHSGPHARSSRGSAVSALLSYGSTPTGTALLVPKTEELSPVQLYSTDRSNLTGILLNALKHFSVTTSRFFQMQSEIMSSSDWWMRTWLLSYMSLRHLNADNTWMIFGFFFDVLIKWRWKNEMRGSLFFKFEWSHVYCIIQKRKI